MLSRTGHIIHAAAMVLALLLIAVPPQAASASDFERGLNAYNAGNYETAIAIWLPLAEQGDARAQYILGIMYAKGRGVPQNYILAHMWYNMAVSQGEELLSGSQNGEIGIHDTLARIRDTLAGIMTPAQVAEAQKLAAKCLESDYQDCGD